MEKTYDGFKETQREELFRYKLLDTCDERYVQKDGTQKLINALVIGCTSLILTGVVLAGLAFLVK